MIRDRYSDDPSDEWRVFISVDVSNSTAFKADRPITDWLPVLKKFFEQFPLVLTGHLALAFDAEPDLPAVDIWKAAGDELVFCADGLAPARVALLLGAVMGAAQAYSQHAFAGLPLALKVTAWSAAFPPNAQLEIPEISDRIGRPHVDFIGPDIDIGFRLGAYARPGNATLSLDLAAWLMRDGVPRGLEISWNGMAALRGVNGGQAYPLLRLRVAKDGDARVEPDHASAMAVESVSMLEALSLLQASAADQFKPAAMESLFRGDRARPAAPERAFEFALAWLGCASEPFRMAGLQAIAAAGMHHPYHDRHHLAEALLAMGCLCAAARAEGSLTVEAAWAGLVAMAGHDLGHDGTRNTDGRLEHEAARAMTGIGAAAGLDAASIAQIRAMILATAPAEVSAGWSPGDGPGGLLGALAREADVAASLMPRLGWRLAVALREEWRHAGDPAADRVAGYAGRWFFLSLYPSFSSAAGRLGLATTTLAQRRAFTVVAETLGLGSDGAAAARALDEMDRLAAARLYLAAQRACLSSEVTV